MFLIWHVNYFDHVIKKSPKLQPPAIFRTHTSSGEINILFAVCHVTLVRMTFDFFGVFTYKQLHFEKIMQLFSLANFASQDELFV